MKYIVSAMPTFLRVSIANMVQYRAEIALWAAWGIVSPAVLMAVWSAAAASSADPGRIQGRTTGELAGYFFTLMIVGHLCTAWDVYEMPHAVRTGRLSPLLLLPILPIWRALADNLAYKLVTLAMLLPIWAVVWLVVRPTLTAGVFEWLVALAALPLASLLLFVWGYAFCTIAFYAPKMDAAGELFFGAGLFFGGRMAPMHFLPKPMQIMGDLMPFQWAYWYPSELLAGQLTRASAVRGLAWQVVWLIVGVVVFRFAWSRGVKRYSAVGA